ncbi:hypothetical protein [Saccharibacillus brassicae]|uniref:Uncharacterized protein n=1 Tax=Saccharibacillus brassicae TaxID=2583377 RepID=A0A4Y6V0C1_SACBS|nr:hypothetical protein [Saccharibacillus brassicae]QDH23469.1 hypothetical protein FFV09_22950 [Saccharibacillus brassicae]
MSDKLDMEELLTAIKPMYTEVTKKAYHEFSQEFFEKTKSEELLIVVLRSHIFIEHEIEILLRNFCIDVKKTKLQFYSQKLDLINSTGVLKKELYDSLSFVNEIRNKFAHRLDYKFDDEIYNTLYSKLPEDTRESLKKEFAPKKLRLDNSGYLLAMRHVLSSLWAELKAMSLDLWGRKTFALDIDEKIYEDARFYLQKHIEESNQILESSKSQKD